MAAPAPTARQTPAGIKLVDGFSTKVTFSRAPAISFWEKTLKPPGLDGGDGIDTTTMFNTAYRTMSPKHLKTLTPPSAKAAYDPVIYNTIVSLINQEGTITYTFPDGSTLAFFGYLKSFEPDDLSEGAMPEASVAIVPTNWDPVGRVEASPVMTEVSGT